MLGKDFISELSSRFKLAREFYLDSYTRIGILIPVDSFRLARAARHRLIHTNPSSRKNKTGTTGGRNANNQANNNANQVVDVSRANVTLSNDTITMQGAVQHFTQGNGGIPLIPVQLSAQQWIATSGTLNAVQNGDSLNNKINTSALINAVST